MGRVAQKSSADKVIGTSERTQTKVAVSRAADSARTVDSLRRSDSLQKVDRARIAESKRGRVLARGVTGPTPRDTGTKSSGKTVDTVSAVAMKPTQTVNAPTLAGRSNTDSATLRSTEFGQAGQSARALVAAGKDSARGTADAGAAGRGVASGAPVGQRFSRDEMRAMAVQIVQGIGTGSRGNSETKALLAGRLPSVELVTSSAVFVSETAGRVLMQCEVNLSAYDLAGLHQKRTAKVTFEATGRRPSDLSNVQIGPLVKQP